MDGLLNIKFLFSVTFIIAVSAQNCSEGALRTRHQECLNQFLNNFYSPTSNDTGSTVACSQSKNEGVDCVKSLVTDCSQQVPQLGRIINPTAAGNAFQFACDSINDVSLAKRCYTNLNSADSLASCEVNRGKELGTQRNIGNDSPTNQRLCLTLDARSACVTSGLQTQCRDQSVRFAAFLAMYYPADCARVVSQNTADKTAGDESGKCSDGVVMTNFTECVKPFFERIEKLDFDKKKCNDSVLEVLGCVRTVVAKCAPSQRFRYIQELLDLQRTKDALDFGCKEDWGLAKGAFCYNKHYRSDIMPCLEMKMRNQVIATGTGERTLGAVCSYIDATTDCARSGMTTCREDATQFSQYVRKFFPDDCTDDKGGASTSKAALGLLVSILIVYVLQ